MSLKSISTSAADDIDDDAAPTVADAAAAGAAVGCEGAANADDDDDADDVVAAVLVDGQCCIIQALESMSSIVILSDGSGCSRPRTTLRQAVDTSSSKISGAGVVASLRSSAMSFAAYGSLLLTIANSTTPNAKQSTWWVVGRRSETKRLFTIEKITNNTIINNQTRVLESLGEAFC